MKMNQETLAIFAAMSVEELRNVLDQIVETHSNHHPSTIYLGLAPGSGTDGAKIYVEEQTLGDGSKVLNLQMRSL
jgi:hypothetical protein